MSEAKANPATLLAKLRKARQSTVKAGGFKFTFMRPTTYQASQILAGRMDIYEVARDYVCDWAREDGTPLQEKDIELIPAPSDEIVPFDRALWAEWLQDHDDWWSIIEKAIMDAFVSFSGGREESKKK